MVGFVLGSLLLWLSLSISSCPSWTFSSPSLAFLLHYHHHHLSAHACAEARTGISHECCERSRVCSKNVDNLCTVKNLHTALHANKNPSCYTGYCKRHDNLGSYCTRDEFPNATLCVIFVYLLAFHFLWSLWHSCTWCGFRPTTENKTPQFGLFNPCGWVYCKLVGDADKFRCFELPS